MQGKKGRRKEGRKEGREGGRKEGRKERVEGMMDRRKGGRHCCRDPHGHEAAVQYWSCKNICTITTGSSCCNVPRLVSCGMASPHGVSRARAL